MTFSSHMDMIFKNSALQDIFVKLLFIEYIGSPRRYPLYEKVMSDHEYISTNSGIHLVSITKGAKPKHNFFVLVTQYVQ